MRAAELTRIVIIIILGTGLVFFLQPWLYNSQTLFIDTAPEEWISNQYLPGAYLISGISVAMTVGWYVLSAGAKILTSKDTSSWRLLWWIFLLVPLLSIGIALKVFNQDQTAMPSLALLFVIDVLILFWLPTVTSSPGHTMFLPPGSMTIRRMIGT
jgi:hypothetical protein